jgi:hypothetical protein
MYRYWAISTAACLLLMTLSARATPPVPRSQTEISGCLAKPSMRAAAPRKRSAPLPREAVTGIVVRHNFSHACCLKGAVTTTVSGGNVEVVESLTGTPCRCLCASTLRTTIPLRPGTYNLVVWLASHDARTRVTTKGLRVVVTARRASYLTIGDKDQDAIEADDASPPAF